MALHIVLVEPEIPANTGNIARTCAATGACLHLVGPLGFSLADRYLKRAGLDYWPAVKLQTYESFAELQQALAGRRMFLIETNGARHYSDFAYRDEDVFVFGKETLGLSAPILAQYPDTCIRLPMTGDVRSLNVSNAVAVVIYEAFRQIGFPDMT
jgi:tRNA (cytidine/uridine-2'-O-)-methyltransferase